MIDVVGGILVKRDPGTLGRLGLDRMGFGRVLLVQRATDKDFPFAWECPGGKVEEGETHRQALRREWLEELAIEVDIRDRCPLGSAIRPWWSGEFKNEVSRPDRAHIKLSLYRVHHVSGAIASREGQGFGWFSPTDVDLLHGAPGLEAIRSRLVLAMKLGVFEPPSSVNEG